MSSLFESIRAARTLLNLSQEELADEINVSRSEIARFERRELKMMPKFAYVLKAELEKRGVEFLEPTEDQGYGVRWKNPGKLDPFQAAQIRTARVMLGLSQLELAELTGLKRIFVWRLENEKTSSVPTDAVRKLVLALEAKGARFIPESEHFGAGVRIKPSS
jgi:transcriptional regulator with XRE-family HTH domain